MSGSYGYISAEPAPSCRLFRQPGLGHVVRVLGTAGKVTESQWQRTASQTDGYAARAARTLAEAERMLDELERSTA
jgi:hypothetical protein